MNATCRTAFQTRKPRHSFIDVRLSKVCGQLRARSIWLLPTLAIRKHRQTNETLSGDERDDISIDLTLVEILENNVERESWKDWDKKRENWISNLAPPTECNILISKITSLISRTLMIELHAVRLGHLDLRFTHLISWSILVFIYVLLLLFICIITITVVIALIRRNQTNKLDNNN